MAAFLPKNLKVPTELNAVQAVTFVRHNIGNVFLLLLILMFATAGMLAWLYIYEPLRNPPKASPRQVKPPEPEKLEKVLDAFDERSKAYRATPQIQERNPFQIP